MICLPLIANNLVFDTFFLLWVNFSNNSYFYVFYEIRAGTITFQIKPSLYTIRDT